MKIIKSRIKIPEIQSASFFPWVLLLLLKYAPAQAPQKAPRKGSSMQIILKFIIGIYINYIYDTKIAINCDSLKGKIKK